MKRAALALLIFATLLVNPFVSQASTIPPNMVTLTNFAKIIFVVDVLSAEKGEVEIEVRDYEVMRGVKDELGAKSKDRFKVKKRTIKRDVIKYTVRPVEIIKNESGKELGDEFSFTTFAPPRPTGRKDQPVDDVRIIPGQKYMLFLKSYPIQTIPPTEIWAFVAGDRSKFKVEKDDEGNPSFINRFRNVGIWEGVPERVSGERVKDLRLRALTKEEDEETRRIQGHNRLDVGAGLIKRIVEIEQKRRVKVPEIKKEIKQETRDEQ